MDLVPVGTDVFGAICKEAEAFFRYVANVTAGRRRASSSVGQCKLLAHFGLRLQVMQARQVNVRRIR